MKTKIFILVALLAVATSVQAQYGADYYHRTGDTVYTRSDIGFYNWWDFEQRLLRRENITISSLSPIPTAPVMITPYFTTAPIRVVGIAGCLYDNRLYYSGPTLPEYFYLFDAGSEGPVYLDRSEIHFQDSTPHRYLHLDINAPQYGSRDSCCFDEPNFRVIDLYECYFDSVITVDDSFYVGWSHNNMAKEFGEISYAAAARVVDFFPAEPCYDYDTLATTDPNTGVHQSNCFFPLFDYYVCNDTTITANPAGSYTWTPWFRGMRYSRMFVLAYPLIEIDTTVPPAFLCEPVQNLQATVLDTGSGCVFFSWDDFLHYTYCELQYYAPRNGIASTVDTIVSGSNILHLCGLDTMLSYYVRARAFCDTSKIETDWSNWVPFSFPHTDPPTPPEPPQGIAEPSVLDRFTHLLPNPASDRVTVMSELGLHRIEVYNARGILVYSEPVGYSQATIDLRGWPAGQYMMSIETRRGKTTKRLVVAR